MRPTRLVLLVSVLVAAFLAYELLFRERPAPGQLPGSGILEIKQVRLAFQVPGRIESIAVAEGDRVHRGQVLATIDSVELGLNQARAAASVTALEARVRALERGSRPAEKAQARAALEAANVQVETARRELTRIRTLATQGVVSPSQLDQATAAFELAVAQRDRAAETYRLVREGARREDIQAARAQLREAQAALQLAETRLAYAQITAPVDGVVLIRAAEPGETIAAGIPVLTVGNLDAPWLNLYVSEHRIGEVKLGQRADVMVDSFPNHRFAGHVAYISDQAEFTPKNVQTKEERVKLVFRVRLDVENPGRQLKPGMPADAIIYTTDQP